MIADPGILPLIPVASPDPDQLSAWRGVLIRSGCVTIIATVEGGRVVVDVQDGHDQGGEVADAVGLSEGRICDRFEHRLIVFYGNYFEVLTFVIVFKITLEYNF